MDDDGGDEGKVDRVDDLAIVDTDGGAEESAELERVEPKAPGEGLCS